MKRWWFLLYGPGPMEAKEDSCFITHLMSHWATFIEMNSPACNVVWSSFIFPWLNLSERAFQMLRSNNSCSPAYLYYFLSLMAPIIYFFLEMHKSMWKPISQKYYWINKPLHTICYTWLAWRRLKVVAYAPEQGIQIQMVKRLVCCQRTSALFDPMPLIWYVCDVLFPLLK